MTASVEWRGQAVRAEGGATDVVGQVDQEREPTVTLQDAVGDRQVGRQVGMVFVGVEELRWRHRAGAVQTDHDF